MGKYFVYIDEQSGNTLFFETEQAGGKNFCGIFYLTEQEKKWKRFNGVGLYDDIRMKQEYIESNLEMYRAQLHDTVNPARDAFLNAGFLYDNGTEKIPFQTDPFSLQKINLAKSSLDSLPDTATITWTTNQKLPNGSDRDYLFTKAEFSEFVIQLVLEGDRIHRKAKHIKTELQNAKTLDELRAVKISFAQETSG